MRDACTRAGIMPRDRPEQLLLAVVSDMSHIICGVGKDVPLPCSVLTRCPMNICHPHNSLPHAPLPRLPLLPLVCLQEPEAAALCARRDHARSFEAGRAVMVLDAGGGKQCARGGGGG